MSKIQNHLPSFDLKISTSRFFLPPIQSFNFSDVSPTGITSPVSGADSMVIADAKILKKSRTMAERIGAKSRKCEGIDPDIQKFHRISLRLEKILDHSQYKYGPNNKIQIKSLSPRVESYTKPGDIGSTVPEKRFKSPNSMKTNLNKHAIRSRVFESTIKWINS